VTGASLTIGDVIGRLAGDFPDLTVSKIRYLESGGLINPERTPAGYRRFTEEDVEKLRWVLSAQRDQYLPLKLIRQHLAAGSVPRQDAGGATAVEVVVPETEPFHGVAADAGELHLRREGLARTAGVAEEFVADLVAFGLLPAAEDYGGDAVFVARAAAALGEFGLEPRHLRPLLTGARNTAGILSSLLPARRHDGIAGASRREAASAAAARTSDAAAAAVRLYGALLRSELGAAGVAGTGAAGSGSGSGSGFASGTASATASGTAPGSGSGVGPGSGSGSSWPGSASGSESAAD
jgi:DNA-binding transcriptional MerR regulator